MAFSAAEILEEFAEASHAADTCELSRRERRLLLLQNDLRAQAVFRTRQKRKAAAREIKALRAAQPVWEPGRAPYVPAPPHALRRWG